VAGFSVMVLAAAAYERAPTVLLELGTLLGIGLVLALMGLLDDLRGGSTWPTPAACSSASCSPSSGSRCVRARLLAAAPGYENSRQRRTMLQVVRQHAPEPVDPPGERAAG
jgi:hypothetical protein